MKLQYQTSLATLKDLCVDLNINYHNDAMSESQNSESSGIWKVP